MTMPFGHKPMQAGYGAPYCGHHTMQPMQPMPYSPYYPPISTPVPGAPMMPPPIPSGAGVTPAGVPVVTLPPVEESYVENILRLNRGKMATIYMTFENNREWNAKIFKGIIEAAGRDHIIISDPVTGMRHLLLMLNLDYVTFDEPIAYEYPFQGTVVTQQTPIGLRANPNPAPAGVGTPVTR